MPSLPKQLPDDIDSLKILVAEQATNNEKLLAQWVSGNLRMTFEFENGDAYVVDYEDYH